MPLVTSPQFIKDTSYNNLYDQILNKITPTFSFTTPGTLNTLTQLQTIANNINANVQPWATAYANMKLNAVCSTTYTPNAWATVNVSVGGSETQIVTDASAAYSQALLYVFTGNTVYSNNCSNILGTWANTITGFAGLNWYLDAAWAGAVFAQAADLLRGASPSWTGANNVCNMFVNVFLPVLHNRLAAGNRGFAVQNALMSIAIFLKDPAALYEAVQHNLAMANSYFYLSTDGNGQIPYTVNYWLANSVPPYLGNTYMLTLNSNVAANVWGTIYPNWISNGVANLGSDSTALDLNIVNGPAALWENPNTYINGYMTETASRDLGHAESAMGECVNVMEAAWNQGLDLYSVHANRLAAAVEIQSALRLGLPGIQEAVQQANGAINSGNGLTCTYEILYNHLVNIKGMSLPNTANLIANVIRHAPASGEVVAPFNPPFPSGLFTTQIFAPTGFAINWETLTHARLNGSSP